MFEKLVDGRNIAYIDALPREFYPLSAPRGVTVVSVSAQAYVVVSVLPYYSTLIVSYLTLRCNICQIGCPFSKVRLG